MRSSFSSSSFDYNFNEQKFCPFDGYRFNENEMECNICGCAKTIFKNEKKNINDQKQKTWKRVLYEKQPFEDNYLDHTFLSCLETKDTFKNLEYFQIVFKSTELSFSISAIIIFLLVFHFLIHKKISDQIFILSLFILSGAGTFLYIILSPKILKIHTILSNIKSIGLILGTIFLFSPVFKSVFQNYAENTTYALTFGCILFHLIWKDYENDSKPSTEDYKIDNSTLSMFFGGLLLGSRLHDEYQMFALLFTTLLLFIFFKFLKRSIEVFSKKLYIYLLFLLFLTLAVIIYKISRILSLLYILSMFFITFLCPLWLIWLYQYKNVIKGPWDLPDVKSYNIE